MKIKKLKKIKNYNYYTKDELRAIAELNGMGVKWDNIYDVWEWIDWKAGKS